MPVGPPVVLPRAVLSDAPDLFIAVEEENSFLSFSHFDNSKMALGFPLTVLSTENQKCSLSLDGPYSRNFLLSLTFWGTCSPTREHSVLLNGCLTDLPTCVMYVCSEDMCIFKGNIFKI